MEVQNEALKIDPKPPAHNNDVLGNPIARGMMLTIISLLTMLTTIGISMNFPGLPAFALSSTIYTVKVVLERRIGINSPLSYALWLVYLGLTGAEVMGHSAMDIAGLIIFSWMFSVISAFLLVGKPVTGFMSKGKGQSRVYIASSLVWMTTYGSALLATLWLMPSRWTSVLPLLNCLIGGSGALFINVIWNGAKGGRQLKVKSGEFEFLQIEKVSSDFVVLCALRARQMAKDAAMNPQGKSWEELAKAIQAEELAFGKSSTMFVCKQAGRVVGGVRCIVGGTKQALARQVRVERGLDRLARLGKVCTIGSLTIDDEFVDREEIVTGLLACVTDLALDMNVSYALFVDAKDSAEKFRKFSFDFVYDEADPRNATCVQGDGRSRPMILDMAAIALGNYRHDKDRPVMSDVANKFLIDRWLRRQALRRVVGQVWGLRNPKDLHELRRVFA